MNDALADRIEIDDASRPFPVVKLRGEFDLSNAPALRSKLDLLGTPELAAIDFTDVPFIDSSIINAVASFGRRVLENGGVVYFVIDRPVMRKIFEITNLDRCFTIVPELDAVQA